MSGAKARESSLWSWLKKAEDRLLNLHISRIENTAGFGTPDVEGCFNGKAFWIELKSAARPSSPTTKIRPKFQPGQPNWHKKRHQAGGESFILLQVGSGAGAKRYLLFGIFAKDLFNGLTEAELTMYAIMSPNNATVEAIIQAVTTHHTTF